MKRAAFGLLLTIAGASVAEDELPPPQVCDDTFAECKEGCTLNWGTSFTTREKLGKCVTKCTSTHDTCLERFMETRRSELETHPIGKDARDREGGPTRFTEPKPQYPHEPVTPEPTPSTEEVPLVERSATRGSDLPPPVDKNVEAYPADPQRRASAPNPTPASAPKAAAPKAAPPKAAAAQPEPAKRPKKDLSEWEPGDIK
jgi:hypothetical protein